MAGLPPPRHRPFSLRSSGPSGPPVSTVPPAPVSADSLSATALSPATFICLSPMLACAVTDRRSLRTRASVWTAPHLHHPSVSCRAQKNNRRGACLGATGKRIIPTLRPPLVETAGFVACRETSASSLTRACLQPSPGKLPGCAARQRAIALVAAGTHKSLGRGNRGHVCSRPWRRGPLEKELGPCRTQDRF